MSPWGFEASERRDHPTPILGLRKEVGFGWQAKMKPAESGSFILDGEKLISEVVFIYVNLCYNM